MLVRIFRIRCTLFPRMRGVPKRVFRKCPPALLPTGLGWGDFVVLEKDGEIVKHPDALSIFCAVKGCSPATVKVPQLYAPHEPREWHELIKCFDLILSKKEVIASVFAPLRECPRSTFSRN